MKILLTTRFTSPEEVEVKLIDLEMMKGRIHTDTEDVLRSLFELSNDERYQADRERLWGNHRSLSVGDIVITHREEVYVCEPVGWRLVTEPRILKPTSDTGHPAKANREEVLAVFEKAGYETSEMGSWTFKELKQAANDEGLLKPAKLTFILEREEGCPMYQIYCPEMRYEGPFTSIERAAELIGELTTEYEQILEADL